MAVVEQKKVGMGSTSATPRGAREGSIMADASGLLHTLQGHVEDVRALLQCGICVRPLYEPYTLACGHTFCYGCLTSWFSSGRSHRTCPDCRAQVKVQPAPAYLVRTIVQLFTSHAELLEKDETTAEHSKNQREEAEKLEADKANEDPHKGGLFQGFFKPKPHHHGPIFDVEDGVARCPNCSWELEEDTCAHCGYQVDDESGSSISGFSDDFSDMTDEEEDDDDHDDEEEMEDADPGFADHDAAWVDEYPHPLPFSFQQIYGAAQHFAPHQHHQHHYYPPYNQFLTNPIFRRPPFASSVNQPSSSIANTSEDESEEEEDDDEEMDSFIDDDEETGMDDSDGESHTDNSTVVGDQPFASYDGYETGTDASSTHSSQDHGYGVAYHGYETETDASTSQASQSVEEDEEADEDDEDDAEPTRPTRISRRMNQNLFSANNISAGRVRNPPSFGLQQNAAGTSAINAINVEDDSEDEQPVPASRRSRINRR